MNIILEKLYYQTIAQNRFISDRLHKIFQISPGDSIEKAIAIDLTFSEREELAILTTIVSIKQQFCKLD